MIDVLAFIISRDSFAAEVVDFLIIRIFFDDYIIAFGEIVLTFEAVEEVKSFVEVGDAEDVNGAKNK